MFIIHNCVSYIHINYNPSSFLIKYTYLFIYKQPKLSPPFHSYVGLFHSTVLANSASLELSSCGQRWYNNLRKNDSWHVVFNGWHAKENSSNNLMYITNNVCGTRIFICSEMNTLDIKNKTIAITLRVYVSIFYE